MGAVFRPRDLRDNNKKVLENSVKDISPDTKDNVIKLLNSSWEEINKKKSKEKVGSQ
jgi:hypothetical protein